MMEKVIASWVQLITPKKIIRCALTNLSMIYIKIYCLCLARPNLVAILGSTITLDRYITQQWPGLLKPGLMETTISSVYIIIIIIPNIGPLMYNSYISMVYLLFIPCSIGNNVWIQIHSNNFRLSGCTHPNVQVMTVVKGVQGVPRAVLSTQERQAQT